jgi:hypothetical protein
MRSMSLLIPLPYIQNLTSRTLHPEIKNDWLQEALTNKGYMSGIMTYYLRHMHGLDFISHVPINKKRLVTKRKRNSCNERYMHDFNGDIVE